MTDAQYDDPVFFSRYRQMRLQRSGLNEDLEQPALARLLPTVTGADVLDIGCGDGTLARFLVGQGARHVLGIDPSRRMLAVAASHRGSRVRYCRASAESFALARGSVDLVVSSMALHYVADYRGLVRRVAQWLRPGGNLIYSVEHPICTARNPMTGWHECLGERHWPVDDYADEAPRNQSWLGGQVTKHHRRITTFISPILAAGLTLSGIDEPYPGHVSLARRPDLADHRRRPPLLIVAARKP
ncbi:MAG TPA: class I SAM-dependent methyltransferase [Streptosporangiaceae bacterium]|nr:class I SAM-dependent methyltransferase [Streptosporangiaceae bacterium]